MFKTLFLKLKYYPSLVEIIEEYGTTALNTLGVAAVVSITTRFLWDGDTSYMPNQF